ncbi:MAG: phosphoribosylanthranilate isomerase [Nitrospirota bacterium]|nr:MAG: phosphoribosylanthranilate isomerase [Nitrospirota bacterium]
MLKHNLIQIAGIIDEAEAEMLLQCGVQYLGFPLRLPVHQEDLTEETASILIRKLKPPRFGVLITYLDDAVEIATFCRTLGARMVQLHGDVAVGEIKKLKELDPELTVVKSLVIGLHTIGTLESLVVQMSAFVDGFITDTYDPISKASGGTGKMHDWSISQRVVQLSSRPVILAGGLTPDNVRKAILEVKPAGVDSHTGVEDASGRKRREKVEKFVAEANAGFQLL